MLQGKQKSHCNAFIVTYILFKKSIPDKINGTFKHRKKFLWVKEYHCLETNIKGENQETRCYCILAHRCTQVVSYWKISLKNENTYFFTCYLLHYLLINSIPDTISGSFKFRKKFLCAGKYLCLETKKKGQKSWEMQSYSIIAQRWAWVLSLYAYQELESSILIVTFWSSKTMQYQMKVAGPLSMGKSFFVLISTFVWTNKKCKTSWTTMLKHYNQ